MNIKLSAAVVVGFVFSFAASPAGADGPDAASQQALSQTQALLRDPQARARAAADSPAATNADRAAQNAGGSAENTNAIYDVSANVLDSLVQQTGGDAGKMQEAMEKAQGDPQAFMASLTPEQQAKIHDISARAPAAQTGNGN